MLTLEPQRLILGLWELTPVAIEAHLAILEAYMVAIFLTLE
jgi:hypothetical protein